LERDRKEVIMKKIEKKIKEIFKKYHGEGCQYVVVEKEKNEKKIRINRFI